MPVYEDPASGVTVGGSLLRDWTVAILAALGTPSDIAADVADVLVASDRRGIASHGTARLAQLRQPRRGRGPQPERTTHPRRDTTSARPLRCSERMGSPCRPGGHGLDDPGGTDYRGRDCGGRSLEPLWDRGLVRVAGSRGRAYRREPHEQLAPRRSNSRPAVDDRHQPYRHRRPGRAMGDVLPRHGDFDDPSRPDRGCSPAWPAPGTGLGDRRRWPAGDDSGGSPRGRPPAPRRAPRRREATRATVWRSPLTS